MPSSRPSSSKGRLTFAALAITLSIYAVLYLTLDRLAHWAELDFHTHPYAAGEEPIRWMLPSMFARDEPTVLLAGPSAIGDAILYEDLERRLGMRVLPGALSNGTLDDVHLGLDYVSRAYGPDALPEAVVLGLSPRVVANIPRSFGPERDPSAYAPLIESIDRYSPTFSVVDTALGSALRPKSMLERWQAIVRMRTAKQQPRQRAALGAALEWALGRDPIRTAYQQDLQRFNGSGGPLAPDALFSAVRAAYDDEGPVRLADRLAAARSPYYYTFREPVDHALIESQADDWAPVYRWDPVSEDELVRFQLDRLVRFLEEHDIEAVVVLLPEHPISRARYDAGRHAAYRQYIVEAFGAKHVLDLERALPAEQFYDQIHVTYSGAVDVTNVVYDALAHLTSERVRRR